MELTFHYNKIHEFFIARTRLKHELCAAGVRRHVDVPEGAKEITLVTSKREFAQSYDILPSGEIADVRDSVDLDVYEWLQKAYDKGERFVRCEYA
jgi:hypothetical protein